MIDMFYHLKIDFDNLLISYYGNLGIIMWFICMGFAIFGEIMLIIILIRFIKRYGERFAEHKENAK